ncbi:MAG TPA: helix-turn-helix domain-containing protein [Fibrobacteria bacterium]|jgi:two-component system response regulator RegA|nr:helix-turn-helix domain-containing protein [Fibrobacteria bacterium]
MNILILEDDAALRRALARELADLGHHVVQAAAWRDVPEGEVATFDAAALDLRLAGPGDPGGLDALAALRAVNPGCRAVLMTGYGSHATALEAGKLGAAHYLAKPVTLPWLLWALGLGARPEGSEPEAGGASLARNEREYIEYVMAQCEGNVSRAARLLGLRRQSLQRKLKKYSSP